VALLVSFMRTKDTAMRTKDTAQLAQGGGAD